MQNYSIKYLQWNPRTHQKDHPPQSKRLFPSDVVMLQHANIDICNPQYKLKKKNYLIISIDAENAFAKIQPSFTIKVLKRLGIQGIQGIQGTYLSIMKGINSKI